jgi:phosphatidylserine/phosphatidylglycerophosphate/cardiolipin synthase-like enzyme
MSDTYTALLAQMTSVMAELPPGEAAALAESFTARINRRIGGTSTFRHGSGDDGTPARVARVLPDHLMNFATLSLPWEAYRHAHGARSGVLAGETASTRLICSLPEPLAGIVRSAGCTPSWSGSLLDALGLVLNEARQEVVMMNPYWSALGVEALIRRITRGSFAGVHVTIMTQPREKLDHTMTQGIDLFLAALAEKGARCKVLAPSPRVRPTPLLHAKVVVADRSHAYLGSANLTGGGMDFSVELGIEFSGTLARQLADWLTALGQGLAPWAN